MLAGPPLDPLLLADGREGAVQRGQRQVGAGLLSSGQAGHDQFLLYEQGRGRGKKAPYSHTHACINHTEGGGATDSTHLTPFMKM